MIRRITTSLLTLVALVSAVNIVCRAESQAVLTHHTRQVTLNGQTPRVGRLPANQSMRITLVLPLRDQSGLDSFLHDVYDRNSASFRHFLTVEQFTERFGPTRQDYETLKQFARDNGFKVVKTSRNRVNLDVVGSVNAIEKAFHVTMGVYQHDTESRTFFSPDREPTVDLPFQLWRIAGMDNYSTPKTMLQHRDPNSDVKSNATTGSGPSASFLGSDMRAAYYSAEGGTLTGTGQYLGLFELVGTDLADLNTYYTNVDQTYSVPITLLSVDTQSTSCIDSRAGGDCDDTEQTLDMTQALGMAPGLSGLTMFIGTGGLSGQTIDDAGIYNAMVTTEPLCAQLSASWNWGPADPNTDNPYFEEMAGQGQSYFTASGDSGEWKNAFYVWPEESVYVITVGGTDLETSSAGGPWSSETGWSDSGGGISPQDYAIPSWQVAAAAGCAKCSQLYRNGPDVAANANFTFYVCADQTKCSANEYGGTSFASPMWAAYLALTNEQYLANGNTTTIGFINPTLYDIYAGSSYDTDFHDITSGGNGYGTAVGYDLSTGLGSMNGPALLAALAGNPVGSFTMAVAPSKATIAPGGTAQSRVTATASGGFDSVITFTASGAPAGVKITFSPGTVTGAGTAAMRIASTAKAAAGTYTITITGTGGSVTQTATFTLTIS
jgi:subtilase family serine protease